MKSLKIIDKYNDIESLISHWDTDGIISSCLLMRALGIGKNQVVLSSINATVKHLVKSIKKGYKKIAILDLNIPEKELTNNLNKVIGKKSLPQLIVIDHHEWSDKSLTLLSVYSRSREFIIEPNYPSTSRIILERILDKSTISDKEIFMVNIADDDDLFMNTYPLTKKLRVILRWSDWKTRYKILEECVNNQLSSRWLDELYQEILPKYNVEMERSLESQEILNIGNMKICISRPSEKIHPGDLQLYIEEKKRVQADIYIFLYKSGLSIRSTKLNVAKLAQELGGGGHPKASGVTFERINEDINIKEKILRLIEKLYK